MTTSATEAAVEARSDGASYLAGLDARGADVQSLGGAVHAGPNLLDVGVKTSLGANVGVRDRVPEARTLAADVAVGSHGNSILSGVAGRRSGLLPVGQLHKSSRGSAGYSNRVRLRPSRVEAAAMFGRSETGG